MNFSKKHIKPILIVLTTCLLFLNSCNKDDFGALHVVTYDAFREGSSPELCFYADHFNDGSVSVSGSPSYSFVEQFSELQANINTPSGVFEPITINIGSTHISSMENIIFGAYFPSPGVSRNLYIFLEDINGNITTSPANITVTDTYQSYTLNLGVAISNGDDGSLPSTCGGGGCTVDADQIAAIHFMVDWPNAFSGALHIDYVELGDGSCFNTPSCILADHFDDNVDPGYIPNNPPTHTIAGELGSELTVNIASSPGYFPLIINTGSIDMALNPIVQLRARTDQGGSQNFKMVLRDGGGHYTSAVPVTGTFTNTFQTYTFDFSSAIANGDDGSIPASSCPVPPCSFDPFNVATIELVIQETAGFNGNLIIDYFVISNSNDNCFPGAVTFDTRFRGALIGSGNPLLVDHGFKATQVSPTTNTTNHSLGPRESFGHFTHSVPLFGGTYVINAYAVSEGLDDTLFGAPRTITVP